jgi:hypothetical protein
MPTKYEEMVAEAEDETEDEDEDEAEAEDTEPEPEPEPEPTEPEAVQLTPDVLKKAEAARKTSRERFAKILGEAAVTAECPMCSGIGFLGSEPPEGLRFTVVAGAQGPELAFEEAPVEVEYRQASDKTTCEACDGHGLQLTGAKNPGGRLLQCERCNGAGWVYKATPSTTAPNTTVTTTAVIPTADNGAQVLAPDAWGRPAGHQHWGVPPAQISG